MITPASEYLIDTCTFLWMCNDEQKLSPKVKELVTDGAVDLYLSTASIWEIAIKSQLKKLTLPEPPASYIPTKLEELEIKSLPITNPDCLSISKLPLLHNDPFDRIMIIQAILNGLTILTPDELVSQYAVAVEW